MVPLRFIRALYCVDSTLHAAARKRRDGRAAARRRAARLSPLRSGQPGAVRGDRLRRSPVSGCRASDRDTPADLPGYADFASLGNLARTLDRAAAAYGSHVRLPIYSTEYGYKTTSADSTRLPTATAAAYLNQTEYLSWRNPRIRSYDQYLLSDPPRERPDSTPVSSYANGAAQANARRLPNAALAAGHGRRRASPLEVWGCARPAPATERRSGRAQSIEVQFAPGAGASYHTVATARSPPAGVVTSTPGELPGEWPCAPRMVGRRTDAVQPRPAITLT